MYWSTVVKISVCLFTSILLILLSLPHVEKSIRNPSKSSVAEVPFPVRFPWNESLCSRRATARGPGQKVIAYSYYGPLADNRGYYWGIEANAKEVPDFYPGWVMRVYHNVPAGDNRRSLFQFWQNSFPHLDFCDARNLTIGDYSGGQPNAWRFLALADPLVEVMVSRDLDSRLTARETAAVDQWLQSSFSFHVMRDSRHHKAVMLAGLWGAKCKMEPELINTITKKLLFAMQGKGKKGLDQDLLLKYVWPSIKGHVMQHDSFYCHKVNFVAHGGMTAFPTQRLNGTSNYVGSILIDSDTVKGCPVQCRPLDHKDWLLC